MGLLARPQVQKFRAATTRPTILTSGDDFFPTALFPMEICGRIFLSVTFTTSSLVSHGGRQTIRWWSANMEMMTIEYGSLTRRRCLCFCMPGCTAHRWLFKSPPKRVSTLGCTDSAPLGWYAEQVGPQCGRVSRRNARPGRTCLGRSSRDECQSVH